MKVRIWGVTLKGGSWLGAVGYPNSAPYQPPLNKQTKFSKIMTGQMSPLLPEGTLVPKSHYRIPVRWPTPQEEPNFQGGSKGPTSAQSPDPNLKPFHLGEGRAFPGKA